MGKSIGKQGRNVGAIRTILGAASARVKNARSLRLFNNPVEKCCSPLYKILKSGTPRHKPLQTSEMIGIQCPTKAGCLGLSSCLAESLDENAAIQIVYTYLTAFNTTDDDVVNCTRRAILTFLGVIIFDILKSLSKA